MNEIENMVSCRIIRNFIATQTKNSCGERSRVVPFKWKHTRKHMMDAVLCIHTKCSAVTDQLFL